MSLLQHFRTQSQTCLALRPIILLQNNEFSSSSKLDRWSKLTLYSMGQVDKKDWRITEKRVDLRFGNPDSRPPRFSPWHPSKITRKERLRLKSGIKEPEITRSLPFNADLVDSLLQKMDGDNPLPDMPDPFSKDFPRCFLCKNNVELNYKNVRLLSQFVSPYTGRIYGRAITGLCIPMEKHVKFLIKRSRFAGYMPAVNKDPRYLEDPAPFNPMKR